MRVQVNVDPGRASVGFVQPLRAAAEATLQELGLDQVGLTVRLSDEDEIREMNHKYAGVNAVTDVLSFADGEVEPDSGMRYLGDVLVCPAVAAQSAAEAGHQLLDELCLLTVHGVLHLLGHDHDEPDRKREMSELQSRILERLGNPAAARRLP